MRGTGAKRNIQGCAILWDRVLLAGMVWVALSQDIGEMNEGCAWQGRTGGGVRTRAQNKAQGRTWCW